MCVEREALEKNFCDGYDSDSPGRDGCCRLKVMSHPGPPTAASVTVTAY